MKVLYRNGLKGQKAPSPGQRPGYKGTGKFALKGQKPYLVHDAFALAGRWLRITFTQGVALGWELSGLIPDVPSPTHSLSGRLCGTCGS